jgi:putative transposase
LGRTLIHCWQEDLLMNDHFWLTQDQLDRIKPYFPWSHGVPRVDDLRVVSGIIHVIKRGLQWRDAPGEYGPPKTLYNRFVRWSRMGVFDKIFAGLAAGQGTPEQLQIDATHLKAHRTAASLLKKGLFPVVSAGQKAD